MTLDELQYGEHVRVRANLPVDFPDRTHGYQEVVVDGVIMGRQEGQYRIRLDDNAWEILVPAGNILGRLTTKIVKELDPIEELQCAE